MRTKKYTTEDGRKVVVRYQSWIETMKNWLNEIILSLWIGIVFFLTGIIMMSWTPFYGVWIVFNPKCSGIESKEF